MTDDTLYRLMKAQLEQAKKALDQFLVSDITSKEILRQVSSDISNCLAIVEAESKYVKRG